MQRAGHEDFETTQRYIRLAEVLPGGFSEVFPALPPELYERGEPLQLDELRQLAETLRSIGAATRDGAR